MHTTQLDMERWNGHIPPLIYSMQKRLLDESRAESLTPQKNTGAWGRMEEMPWRGDPPPPSQVTAPHIRGIYITRRMHVHVAAGDIALAPGPRKPPASLARPLLGGDLAQPATDREGAPKGQRNASAPGGKGGERCCAHHSSTHSCGETSIPSGAPLPSTGRNHGDPPAPGGSALALSIR